MSGALGVALLGLALVVAGGLFDAEQLYVPGAALLVLAIGSWVAVRLAARGLHVERRLEATRVIEEEPLAVVVEVTSGAVPLAGGEVRDPLLGEPVPLPPGRRHRRVRIAARFGRRGRRVLAAPEVTISDPLGLSRRSVAGDHTDEVLVLPRIEPVSARVGGTTGGAARLRDMLAAEAGIEVDGIRPYREGTPATRIFWPAAARGHGLMERRLTSETDARPLVVVDARLPSSAEALDAAVRAAASIAYALAKTGGCALLLPGERRASRLDGTLAGWNAAHARLALVEAGRAPAPGALSRRHALLVYVAARSLRALPAGVPSGPGTAHVLVVPGSLPDRRALLTVAGCTGYDLSSRSSAPREAVA